MSAEPWKNYTPEKVRAMSEDFEFTREERKVLAAFAALLDRMRSTPPAKEPVSVDGSFGDDPDDHAFAITWDKPLPFNTGDRVRVVKIEGTT